MECLKKSNCQNGRQLKMLQIDVKVTKNQSVKIDDDQTAKYIKEYIFCRTVKITSELMFLAFKIPFSGLPTIRLT